MSISNTLTPPGHRTLKERSLYTMYTLSRKRLVDKLVEAYVAWRETCARVDDAYGAWAREPGPRGGVAFALYVAALDAEQQVARRTAR
jgi:hypothetical protein